MRELDYILKMILEELRKLNESMVKISDNKK